MMKTFLLVLALVALTTPSLCADGLLTLTKRGVECDVGAQGKITLGIPALDGRGTHLGPINGSVVTDGKTLTAKFGHPFDGVTLQMKILDGNRVEYTYSSLPKDLYNLMCGFNVPTGVLVPGLTVNFDAARSVTIPAQPGKENKDVSLIQVNSQKLEIKWPSGETLALTGPVACWHGIQDARVWGFKYISVVLVTQAIRTPKGGDISTFVMDFGITGPAPARPQ